MFVYLDPDDHRSPPLFSAGVPVHLYRIDLDAPDTARLAELSRITTPAERARAAAFREERRGRRFLVGRGVLRRLLARYLNRAPEALEVAYLPHGKPYLPDSVAPVQSQSYGPARAPRGLAALPNSASISNASTEKPTMQQSLAATSRRRNARR